MKKIITWLLITTFAMATLSVADENAPANREIAAKQRRYEIMILLQAYRLVAPALKEGIKQEILTRLSVDCQENQTAAAAAIAQAETHLQKLKSEAALPLTEKVAREFKRLESTTIGGMGPHGWCNANCAQDCNCSNQRPNSAGENCGGGKGKRPNNN